MRNLGSKEGQCSPADSLNRNHASDPGVLADFAPSYHISRLFDTDHAAVLYSLIRSVQTLMRGK